MSKNKGNRHLEASSTTSELPPEKFTTDDVTWQKSIERS